MRVPQSPQGFVDTIKMELYIALLLADEPRLGSLPILPEFKLQAESDLTVDALVDSPRSSFTVTASGVLINVAKENQGIVPVTGCGLLVEEPQAGTDAASVRGQTRWEFSVVAFEDRSKNWTPKVGTMIPASVALQIARDALHLQQVYGFGCLELVDKWLTPAHDWETIKPGYNASRLTMVARTGTVQSQRTPGIQADFSVPGQCTLKFVDPDDPNAVLCYTLDGTPPVKANQSAQLYQAPFAVNSGDTITAAARSTGKALSEIFGFTSP